MSQTSQSANFACGNDDRDEWTALSLAGLGLAYAKSEPKYSTRLVKDPNPEYKGDGTDVG